MSEIAAKDLKLNSAEIFKEVIMRENSTPTGIANYLAIPHSRIKSPRPIIVTAINKKGIDFESADNLHSRIIVLLLTPAGENELQLKLLSEIAKKFSDKEKIEGLLNIKNEKEFVDKLKALN